MHSFRSPFTGATLPSCVRLLVWSETDAARIPTNDPRQEYRIKTQVEVQRKYRDRTLHRLHSIDARATGPATVGNPNRNEKCRQRTHEVFWDGIMVSFSGDTQQVLKDQVKSVNGTTKLKPTRLCSRFAPHQHPTQVVTISNRLFCVLWIRRSHIRP